VLSSQEKGSNAQSQNGILKRLVIGREDILRPRTVGILSLPGLFVALLAASGLAQQQADRQAFRAVRYEVDAQLETISQALVGRAKVELVAQEAARFVELELNPNLTVQHVTDGKTQALNFDRDASRPNILRVILTEPALAGQHVTVTVEYAGPVAVAEFGSQRTVSLAWISQQGAYLLPESRWFPLTHFPGNRFTGVFRIHVPEGMSVVGTGIAEPPELASASEPAPVLSNRPRNAREPGQQPKVALPAAASNRVVYAFRVEQPAVAGTFVAGALQRTQVQAEGLTISVYTRPADAGTAEAWGQAGAELVNFFSGEFGPLPAPNLSITQYPGHAIPGYSAPGLVLVSQRRWSEEPDRRLLAEQVARQWWGVQVLPATANDVWLADGLARYSEALYLQETQGEGAFNEAIDTFAVGALMYEDAAPIVQAGRLTPHSAEYRSVVANKGAMVFHMLRNQLGDEAFRKLIRDFYAQYAGKTATIENFRAMAMQIAEQNAPAGEPVNLTPFFTQWLNSTGVPEFQLEYVVFRTQRGFKIVGKVKQDLETFRMKVGMKIETEGNPEFKTIEVRGRESDFTVETFGRPKPGGITLDPNNHLLKSSPQLRVRAAIARGEAYAETGQFYEAIQEYERAITLDKNSSLAHFRMGEAMFFQKNYQAAANAFRNALDGNLDPKWVEVWSHIYLGKIFDLTGQRERAINEYSRALELNDNTGGAQEEARKYIQQPYREESQPASN
jgi:tetratricopeptide (TPR) repeat protein